MLKQKKIVSRGAGEFNPVNVAEYSAIGGFGSLKKAVTMEPLAIIEEVKKAVLLGRGGAAYPAGKK